MNSTNRKPRVEHGMSYHPLYRKWQDMIQRCYNPNDQKYPWYGAKGVTVCGEWKEDPVAFIRWAEDNGWIPGLEIDKDTKVKGSKIYSPDTCSLISHRQNMVAVVGRQSGKKTSKLKLSVEDVRAIILKKGQGEKSSILARQYGVDVCTINRAYRKGA